MIRGVTYSRKSAVAALAMVAAAALVGAGRLQWQRSWRRRDQRAEEAVRDLAAQVDSLAGFDQARLAALRARVRAQREFEGSVLTWDRLIARLGPRWRPDNLVTAERERDLIRRGTFTLVDPTAADWPEIEAVVRDLEAMPGVAIDTLDMAAAATGFPRALELVQIKVVVRMGRTTPATLSHE